MSYPTKVAVQVKDGPAFTEYSNLTVSQFMFAHHTFSLDISFEDLGKALGISPETVHTQAHQKLVGKNITISWQATLPVGPASTFNFRGILTEASIRSNTDLSNYYHLSGYSPTVLLEDGLQNRSFRQKTLQAIFQQVLTPYPSDAPPHELQTKQQQTLPYVVQYQESNYQFLSRLAASQGEWLLYDGLTLRLGPLPQQTATRFQTNGVQNFALNMRLQPLRTEGGAYNYRTHEPLHSTAAPPTAGHPYNQLVVKQSQQVFTQPQRPMATTRLADQSQLQQNLDTRAAQQAGSLVTLQGNGEVCDLAPGHLLDVYDAPGASYGQFRVLAVRHELDGDGNYTNHFEALPAALDKSPAQPASAPLAQPELAEVLDVADPRRLGRIRVRFQWPVAQPADAESGWVRVSTPYSGDGKGQLFTPEVGSQVLVGYQQGLAEFPVVLGNLFHPKNKQEAKYTNPQNNLKGMQTAGGNKFVMSDAKDDQKITISNSNNKDTAIEVSFKGDGSVSIKSKGPISLTAGGNITLTATKDITLTAENINLKATKKIDKSAKEIALTGTDKVDLNGKATTIQAGNTMKIGATSSLEVNGGSHASISSGKTKIH